jgi:hypothetical protein
MPLQQLIHTEQAGGHSPACSVWSNHRDFAFVSATQILPRSSSKLILYLSPYELSLSSCTFHQLQVSRFADPKDSRGEKKFQLYKVFKLFDSSFTNYK